MTKAKEDIAETVADVAKVHYRVFGPRMEVIAQTTDEDEARDLANGAKGSYKAI